MNTKRCTTCKETKTLDLFARNRYKTSGYQDRCKKCTDIYNKKKRLEKKLNAPAKVEKLIKKQVEKPVMHDDMEPTITIVKTNFGYQEIYRTTEVISCVINYNKEGKRHGCSYVKESKRYNITYFNNGVNISPWKYMNPAERGGNEE